MMNGFGRFIAEAQSEEQADVKDMLGKLPKSHAALVGGFRWKFVGGNVLPGDDASVGMIDTGTKTITVAAPWRYSREFTSLHEVGHRVWAKFVDATLRAKWKKIVAATGRKMKQNDEELFCMAYAAAYAENKVNIHDHPAWAKFVKNVPV